MCDPLTIGGLALGALGIGANSLAASRVADSRNRALAMQNQLKTKLQAESNEATQHSLDQYKDTAGQTSDRAKTIANFAKSNAQPGPSANLVPTSDSTLVTDDAAGKSATARGYTDSQADRLGDLRAFGSVLADNSLAQARDAQKVGMLGGFQTANAGYLPLQLDAANNSQNGLKTIGSIATGLGSVGLAAGLSGQPFLGFAGTPANEAAKAALTGAGATAGKAAAPGSAGVGSSLLNLFK